MDLLGFYHQVKDRRYYLFNLIEPSFFNIEHDTVWTIEGIFRHILWGIGSISKYLGGKFSHELMIKTDEQLGFSTKKSAILVALEKGDKLVISKINDIDNTWLSSPTKTYYGKEVTHEFQIYSMLCHELEHHGQIRSLFSKLSNMSTSEMYGTN